MIALNVETGENVDADFVVTSEKTGKVYKAEKVKAKEGFSFKLSQNDNLKVEVTSEGLATGRSIMSLISKILDRKSVV